MNRITRWCDDGLEYEADPRLAAKLIEEVELAGEGVKAVATTGVKCKQMRMGDDVPLAIERHINFRDVAARANYLPVDRPVCQLATKEICGWMSAPTELAVTALRRVCQYLMGKPRLVFRYVFQEFDSTECYSDTDWAGCPRTRKSTSGGVLLLGQHHQDLFVDSADFELVQWRGRVSSTAW